MPPVATSALVDAIPSSDAACLATDQYGTARPEDSGCDIGAVELVS